MNKNKNNTINPLFLQENYPSNPVKRNGIFNTYSVSIVENLTNIESITIDLPIAYANIRV
ncbi:MAG: hypothetical protein RIQ59_355 [Bacteroidota bacterium]|jgi:hypothetical protein